MTTKHATYAHPYNPHEMQAEQQMNATVSNLSALLATAEKAEEISVEQLAVNDRVGYIKCSEWVNTSASCNACLLYSDTFPCLSSRKSC